MFADDTKVWTQISTLKDGEVLQDNLNNLMSWSDKWKLGFNPEKCKVMHIQCATLVTRWIQSTA